MRNRMTTRDIQREETKKRIYDVAFKLFDEFGYDKVKVSDIAKAANVSVGSVYYLSFLKVFDKDIFHHYEDMYFQHLFDF